MVSMETLPLITIIRVKLSFDRGIQGDADTSAKRGRRGAADGSASRRRGKMGMRAATQLMGTGMPLWGTSQKMWAGRLDIRRATQLPAHLFFIYGLRIKIVGVMHMSERFQDVI
jgi:hypothetical protein